MPQVSKTGPISVAVDLAPVRAQPAGVGLYVALLAEALVRLAPEEIRLIGVRPDAGAWQSLPDGMDAVPARHSPFHAWMQLEADRAARSTGATLVHYTNAAAPIISRLPYVLTVHDLSVVRMPGSHPRRRRMIVPLNLAAIARARQVIVPSRWTARELHRIGVASRRITVIAHAPTLQPEAADLDAPARLGLGGSDYILYVGTLEPRKNIERLIAAFELLAARREELRLVLVGAPGWLYDGIEQRIESSPFRDRIVRPGYLAGPEVGGLIARCATFAYVSIYEGFGMPVLDAMPFGAAIVTSRTTAMPEAAGGAALLVDPRDPADIARGLDEAMSRRAELRELALARAAQRTWDDVAREHLAAYRSAAARSHR